MNCSPQSVAKVVEVRWGTRSKSTCVFLYASINSYSTPANSLRVIGELGKTPFVWVAGKQVTAKPTSITGSIRDLKSKTSSIALLRQEHNFY